MMFIILVLLMRPDAGCGEERFHFYFTNSCDKLHACIHCSQIMRRFLTPSWLRYRAWPEKRPEHGDVTSGPLPTLHGRLCFVAWLALRHVLVLCISGLAQFRRKDASSCAVQHGPDRGTMQAAQPHAPGADRKRCSNATPSTPKEFAMNTGAPSYSGAKAALRQCAPFGWIGHRRWSTSVVCQAAQPRSSMLARSMPSSRAIWRVPSMRAGLRKHFATGVRSAAR